MSAQAAAAAATAQLQQHSNTKDSDDGQPMSKRQQKRLLKMERQQQHKKARKEALKEEKQRALEQKREAIEQLLAGMTEQEQKDWHQKNKEKRQQAAEARAATKSRHQQALSAAQKLVIDLDFDGLMSAGELKSLCQQLSYSYSIAVNGDKQMHLHLLGAQGDIEAALHKQLPGHVHWSVTKSQHAYQDYFKDRMQDLVYLTADSPDELSELDPNKIYILGGLVDRNRHKGICYKRAQETGVATARLPITQHMKLATSAVITVNQVVDIMSRLQVTPEWKTVLEAVLPGRKRVGGGEEGKGVAVVEEQADGNEGDVAAAGEEDAAAPEPAAAAAAAEAAAAAAATSQGGWAGVVRTLDVAPTPLGSDLTGLAL